MLQQSIETIRTSMETKISVNTHEIELTRSRINDQMLAVENSVINEMQKQNLDLCVMLKQLQYLVQSSTFRKPSRTEPGYNDERDGLEERAHTSAMQSFDIEVEQTRRRTTHI